MLNISLDFIDKSLSSLRLSFDTLIGRSNTGVLLALLIKYRKQHFAKSAMIFYVQEILCTRNKIQVRRFGSANLSALVNIAKYMYTLFEYKTKCTNCQKKGWPK